MGCGTLVHKVLRVGVALFTGLIPAFLGQIDQDIMPRNDSINELLFREAGWHHFLDGR